MSSDIDADIKKQSLGRVAVDTPANNSPRGGARPGSGRPKGSGQFNEPTKPIRVPLGSLPIIEKYLAEYAAQSNCIDTQQNSAPAQIENRDTSNTHSAATRSSKQADLRPNVTLMHAHNSLSPELRTPLFSSKITAGTPASAEDHIEDTLDLNQYLVSHPESTYMLKVEGESMRDIGILPNDILVVDRALRATHNKIVIAAINGQLTVKRLFHRNNVIKLLPENNDFPVIELSDDSELIIWGVVVGSIRKFQAF